MNENQSIHYLTVKFQIDLMQKDIIKNEEKINIFI